jgi:hypothetical protein
MNEDHEVVKKVINDDEIIKELIYSSRSVCCNCDCHNQPTVLDPIDAYMTFLKNPDLCLFVGIKSIEDVEKYVMRMYLKEFWPQYLRDKYE